MTVTRYDPQLVRTLALNDYPLEGKIEKFLILIKSNCQLFLPLKIKKLKTF